MITQKHRWYYSQVLLLAFGLAIAFFLQNNFNANQNRVFFYGIPVIALIINLLITKVSSETGNARNFTLLLSKIFGIKFFSYLAMTLIFFLIEKVKEQRFVFIGFLFVEYLINTISILRFYLKSQKSIS